MNPLYNGAAKQFKLTSLFSFNINFSILYPQLYSTARNHINRLKDNLASESSKVSKDETQQVFTLLLKALPQIELENVRD